MQPIYDFIVVGAGSAGCAIAARLSEDSSVSVLLIEAGPDSRSWKIDMPLAVDQLLTSTTFNWGFETVAEPGLGGRKIAHPRGRVVGGSSAINGMVYTRGNPQDYDAWRDEHGCAGWGYADVLGYFKRMETAPRKRTRYRGGDGPMRVSSPDAASNPLNAAFLRSARQCGYPLSEDGNGAQHEGFAASEMSIRDGRRLSTAKAYLTDAVRRRPNLTIEAGLLTERLLFEGRKAVGVVASRGGERLELRARREVVLAAGAVGSPQLLMLSGVGPAAHLRLHGIPIVLDQPAVGSNLQDHPDLAIQFACTKPVSLLRHARGLGRIRTGLAWFLAKRGVAATNQFEAAGYFRTRAGIKKPNMKLEFFPLAVSPIDYRPYAEDAFQIHMTMQNARSRGSIRLQGPDVRTPPELKLNYLSDEADLRTYREAIALTRELVASAAFDAFRGREIDPGAAVQSETDLNAWIRSRVTTAYHLSCTCRMGKAADPTAVVGSDLRAHGLEGLRIADASVMPEIVTANLNATVIMIGERAADFLLGKPQLAPDNAPYWVHPAWETSQR